MKRQPKIYLEHILECISLIEGYKEGKREEDFRFCIPLQDMIVRRLMIIGEAVKNLPYEIRESNPDIFWKKIAGLRDVLITTILVLILSLYRTPWRMICHN